MLIKTSLRNREVLIDFLVNETGEKPKYLGAPGFKYEIGPYTVTRNGDLQLEGSHEGQRLHGKGRRGGNQGFLPDG